MILEGPTSCEGLYLLDQNSIERSYLACVEVESKVMPVTIYIEIFSKFIPEGLGYPELLVNHTSELARFF